MTEKSLVTVTLPNLSGRVAVSPTPPPPLPASIPGEGVEVGAGDVGEEEEVALVEGEEDVVVSVGEATLRRLFLSSGGRGLAGRKLE